MSSDREKSRPLTPAELVANFDASQGRPTARDRAIAADVAAWRAAEGAILAELRDVGVEVDSLWDLVGASASFPNSLPVLLDHLERGDAPEQLAEAMARALAVRRSVGHWDRIVALYRAEQPAAVRSGLAAALGACATAEQADDLLALVTDASLGTSRVTLVGPALDHGARSARRVLDALRDDPVIGAEVTTQLERRPLRRPR